MNTIKPANFATYIADFPPSTKKLLKLVRSTIKKTAPAAEEIISYGMPAFRLHGNLVYFAGYKNHIGFYALPAGNAAFRKELAVYKTGKGSIQFPIDQPLPVDLITRIVEYRVAENIARETTKKTKSKKVK